MYVQKASQSSGATFVKAHFYRRLIDTEYEKTRLARRIDTINGPPRAKRMEGEPTLKTSCASPPSICPN